MSESTSTILWVVVIISITVMILSGLFVLANDDSGGDKFESVDINGFEHETYNGSYEIDVGYGDRDINYRKVGSDNYYISVENYKYHTRSYFINDTVHYSVKNEDLDEALYWSENRSEVDFGNSMSKSTGIDKNYFVENSASIEVKGDKIIVNHGNEVSLIYLNDEGYIERISGYISYSSNDLNSSDIKNPDWINSLSDINEIDSMASILYTENSHQASILVVSNRNPLPHGILYTQCGVLVGFEAKEHPVFGPIGQEYIVEKNCNNVEFAGLYKGGIIEFYSK